MEPGGVVSLSKPHGPSVPDIGRVPSSIPGILLPSRPSSPKQLKAASSASYDVPSENGVKVGTGCIQNGSINDRKPSNKSRDHIKESPDIAQHSKSDKLDFVGPSDVLSKKAEIPFPEKMTPTMDSKSRIELPADGAGSRPLSGWSESELGLNSCDVAPEKSKGQSTLETQPTIGIFPSPQDSLYSFTNYAEAKDSFTNTEASEGASSMKKSGESCGEVSNSCDYVESRKTSIYRGSTGSDISDDSSSSSFSSTLYKPHKANDIRWEAIQAVRSRERELGLCHFRLLTRLGSGDIGSVYLSELAGTRTYFAMKIMDKAALASRKKLLRAQTEREILQSLDHPFLPTLYSHFETEKFSCLLMEFCPGGDLHALRQRQHGKYFPEHAARFYVAEVLLALEYLHMLGIIYRDLKPENVLVREDGHIMLSDFDLSLRCSVCPTLIKSSNTCPDSKNLGYCVEPACIEPNCIIQPACIRPACFVPRFFSSKPKTQKKARQKSEIYNQVSPLPELIAEPTGARSMSFVGTHEYLAPEIIKGEGHGSAVDWWTFGIFLYELLYGKTPFKGSGNRATLFNVVGQPLRFPDTPAVSFAARDLIRGLLVKEPQNRLAYRRGATEVKQHPFFQSVNWALIRCTSPPEVPRPCMMDLPTRPNVAAAPTTKKCPDVDVKPSGNYLEIDFF